MITGMTTMPKRTGDYRAWQSQQLTDPAAATSYLNAALEDSLEMFRIAIANVAKAHQVSRVAERAGVAREAIYRTFSAVGNPTLETLVAVLRELKLELNGVKPLGVAAPAQGARKQLLAAGGGRRKNIYHSAAQLLLDFDNASANEVAVGPIPARPVIIRELRGYIQPARTPNEGFANRFIPPMTTAAAQNAPIV